jgi:hypothetical protein
LIYYFRLNPFRKHAGLGLGLGLGHGHEGRTRREDTEWGTEWGTTRQVSFPFFFVIVG